MLSLARSHNKTRNLVPMNTSTHQTGKIAQGERTPAGSPEAHRRTWAGRLQTAPTCLPCLGRANKGPTAKLLRHLRSATCPASQARRPDNGQADI